MQFLTLEESIDAAGAWGLNVDGHGRPLVAIESGRVLRVELPRDSGRRIAFIRSLWLTAFERQRVLICVTSWGVWPSSEHMPLAEAARRGMGATTSLDERPGSMVEPDEWSDGVSLLLLAALFGWDSWLLGAAAPHTLLSCSHDEYIDVYSNDDGCRAVEGMLAEFDLRARAASAGS